MAGRNQTPFFETAELEELYRKTPKRLLWECCVDFLKRMHGEAFVLENPSLVVGEIKETRKLLDS